MAYIPTIQLRRAFEQTVDRAGHEGRATEHFGARVCGGTTNWYLIVEDYGRTVELVHYGTTIIRVEDREVVMLHCQSNTDRDNINGLLRLMGMYSECVYFKDFAGHYNDGWNDYLICQQFPKGRKVGYDRLKNWLLSIDWNGRSGVHA